MAKRLKSKHLYELAFVSDPQLSNDGRKAAAVITTIVTAENQPPRYQGRIDLFDIASGEARALTNGPVTDTSPKFSANSRRLAYLSVREPGSKPQLFVIELDGGEARAVTSHPAGVDAFAWDPSDQSLVYLSKDEAADTQSEGGRPRTVSRLRYKLDGVGFLASAASILYRRHLDQPEPLILAEFELAPSEVTCGPDGLVYVVAPSGPEEHDDWRQQIWRLGKNGKKRRALLAEPEAVGSLSVDPKGSRLAYLAPSVPQDSTSPTGVWVLNIKQGRSSLLTGDLEAAPSLNGDSRYGRYSNAPVWAEEHGSILANLNIEGRSGLARVGLDGSVKFVQDEQRAVTAFQAGSGRAVFVAEDPLTPGELFVRFRNGRERQLSHVNDDFLLRYELGTPDGPFQAGGNDEAPVRYWTLAPTKARKDNAMVLQIHGGPHTNYGYGFSFEFHYLAAAGFTVVFGNPRGSSSFGRPFSASMHGAYGTVDADDVLAIADHALAHHGDPKAPLHLTGGSYGGFMTNWLLGHTDRFRSAVTQRSISNWLSFFGTSDIGYRFTVQQLAGTPWANTDLLWQQSPIKYVAEVVTPLLIIHSEQDHRCPVEQAEQFFVALKSLGRAETKLIRFPDEGHDLSRSGRPDRRLARLEAMRSWFQDHP